MLYRSDEILSPSISSPKAMLAVSIMAIKGWVGFPKPEPSSNWLIDFICIIFLSINCFYKDIDRDLETLTLIPVRLTRIAFIVANNWLCAIIQKSGYNQVILFGYACKSKLIIKKH